MRRCVRLQTCPFNDHDDGGLQAISAAKKAWGTRKLDELEAEERLAIACEKAPTTDPVTQKLRAVVKVRS